MRIATVERVHVPQGAPELQAHLFVNSGVHHAARGGAGHIDVGMEVTVVYRSGGRYVSVKSQRTPVGGLPSRSVDGQTFRVMVKVPHGGKVPDAGTTFVGSVEVFTKLPGGGGDHTWGPAD